MTRFCVAAEFPATHRIRVDDRGTLEPVHAHNWRVRAWFRAEDAPPSLLREAIATVASWVERHRGRCFNDLPPFDAVNPTAEEVARQLARLLAAELPEAEVVRVEVGEAAGFSATYWPGPPGRGAYRCAATRRPSM